ncbi:hypothetical protein [Afipia carboxidovorans]|uniref:hypothetical protein n=1 Tax=Afipia carboxidovorans TaxID=40137 RepID=UPI0002FA284C|nr:hypothetical protein [Afipia carboxidovorans]BEV47273.1 hypothetical protein CRBSH125_34560 [Afipia carboxidovorans]
MKHTALAALIAVTFAGSAHAADFPVKAAAAPAMNWTGFYAGVNAGGGWFNGGAEYPKDDLVVSEYARQIGLLANRDALRGAGRLSDRVQLSGTP